jgi:tetratricopeptide (TPR) repeat protein
VGDDLNPPPRLVDARRQAEDAFGIAEADPARALELISQLEIEFGAIADSSLQGLLAWGRGLALRGLGKANDSSKMLREALASFESAGDRLQSARVEVNLANDALAAGRVDEALRLLDQAQPDLTNAEMAPVEMQRAVILQRSGRVADAFAAFDRAVHHFHDLGDRTAEAKARGNRGLAHAYRGSHEAAAADLEIARRLFAETGDVAFSALITHNLGFVAARQGNLPRALRLYDESQREARAAGLVRPEALIDRVETMLDAGLASEARLVLVAAIAELERQGLEHDLAEACYLAARASEEDGDPTDAYGWAERAAALFAEQDRPRWHRLAEYRMLRAELATQQSKELAARLARLADELRAEGWWLVALEADASAIALASTVGDLSLAHELLDKIRPLRRGAPSLARLDTWIAEAQFHRASGDPTRAGRALSAAFQALDDYRSVLGSLELRTRANQRAQEAASLGVALAIDAGRPERALYWLERARIGLGAPMSEESPDEELSAALATLRQVTSQLEREPESPRDAQRLRRQQVGLEEVVRRRERSVEGTDRDGRNALPRRRPVALSHLRTALEKRVLVEYATVDDRLVAVAIDRRHINLVELGHVASVRLAVTALRIALGRVATGQIEEDSSEVTAAAAALDDLLIERLTRPGGLDTSRGLIVVPTGPVASVPWGALPSLRETPLVVSPSATNWTMNHLGPRPPIASRVVVVVGPDLRFADEEAEAVAEIWGAEARILRGSEATAANVLEALEHAELVHVAAHGTFRDDNPLLSAIRLADGGLTGYDLKRLRHPPATIVLSSCDVGMSESDATGTFGLCGLLVEAGVLEVVASVAPVIDESAPLLMAAFHRALREDRRAPTALVAARAAQNLSPDGFVCFGN